MSKATEFETAEVVEQLRNLGVKHGGVLLTHISYRAVRPIQGGPAGLIKALRIALGARGTLVMPSWTGNDDEPFDSGRTPASAQLGAVADLFWRLPGVVRSDHPFAFAGAGPSASNVVFGPLPIPPHAPGSPVSRVYGLDGQVLLLGVNHSENTSLHLAELIGNVPYRVRHYYTILRDGKPVRVQYGENDHCCARFTLMDGWLRERSLQAEGRVGHGEARLMQARDVIRVALEHLEENALVFLHVPNAGCAECDLARSSLGGPEQP